MQLQLRTLALPLQPHPGLTLRLETPVVGAGTAKSGLHFVCNAHTPCIAHHLQTGECTAVDSGVVMCCERACVRVYMCPRAAVATLVAAISCGPQVIAATLQAPKDFNCSLKPTQGTYVPHTRLVVAWAV